MVLEEMVIALFVLHKILSHMNSPTVLLPILRDLFTETKLVL